MNPTEREELARLLPSPGEPALPSDRLAQLEAHLMQEITREAPTPSTRSAGDGPVPSRPLRLLAATAIPLGTVAAVVAAVLTVVIGRGGQPSTDPKAVELLNRIAAVAAAQDTPPVRDEQYVYTVTQGTQQIMDEGQDTFRRSDWLAVDGERDGLSRITVLAGPSGKRTRDMKLQADPNGTTYRELEALPTDTGELYKKIWTATKGQGPTHEKAALEMIGSMLQGATLLPAVEAALYRTAARIPGVTVVDDAQDAAGRAGVGLAFGDGKDHEVWVFEKKNLSYLGSDRAALLDIDVVDKVGQTPAD
ncbi:CU044_5270 family protein [Streptomyces sp. NPDC052721]|uniref:CU044_5270 family protein n=1 Tax=Streptomyces sp. NPDC052721 TaxID=3154955 RepID=UPI003428CA37